MTTFVRLDPDPSKADYLPYAPAVVVPAGSEYYFLSGITAIPLYHAHPHLPEEVVLPDDIAEQTRRVMTTLTELLAELGLDWTNVIHTYDFLTDMRDNGPMQGAKAQFLGELADWTPASTLIAVNSLSAPGARFEFDVIAARPPLGPVSARRPLPKVEVPGYGPVASTASDEELLWMSGSTAIDFYHHHPHIEDEEDVPYRGGDQAVKILEMFDPVLESVGSNWGEVVKFYEWSTDARDLVAVDAAVAAHFAGLPAHPPTTKVDIAGLSGPAARLELEMIVSRGPSVPGEPGEHEPVVEIVHPQADRAHQLPYAPAVRVIDAPLHFLPGLAPALDDAAGALPDDIVAQTRLVMDALDAHLAALGLGWRNVVKVIQQVTDMREADQIGVAVAERYGTSWTPAGTLTQVDALPARGARVQFDVILAG